VASALRAGAAYFAAVFALGFVLGTLRVVWIAPWLGETGAVVLELPVMLAASWIAAGRLVRRFDVARTGERAAMGAIGFALLMIAEASLGVLAFGDSFAGWAAGLVAMPGIIGLTGQIAFAAMPLVAGRGSRRYCWR
jgi:hypothetical protein